MVEVKKCDNPDCGKELPRQQLGYNIFPLNNDYELRVFMAKPKERGEAYAQIGDFCDDCIMGALFQVTIAAVS